MKKILLLLSCFVFSLNAMKRKAPSTCKEKPLTEYDDHEKIKKVVQKNETIQEALERREKILDEEYPRRFYYNAEIPRKLADKYCAGLSLAQYGFGLAYYHCQDYEDGKYYPHALFKESMQKIRPFLVRYTTTVMEKAKALQDSGALKPRLPFDDGSNTNWEATACLRVVKSLHNDPALLSYILRGTKEGHATQKQLDEEWKRVSDIVSEITTLKRVFANEFIN